MFSKAGLKTGQQCANWNEVEKCYDTGSVFRRQHQRPRLLGFITYQKGYPMYRNEVSQGKGLNEESQEWARLSRTRSSRTLKGAAQTGGEDPCVATPSIQFNIYGLRR